MAASTPPDRSGRRDRVTRATSSGPSFGDAPAPAITDELSLLHEDIKFAMLLSNHYSTADIRAACPSIHPARALSSDVKIFRSTNVDAERDGRHIAMAGHLAGLDRPMYGFHLTGKVIQEARLKVWTSSLPQLLSNRDASFPAVAAVIQSVAEFFADRAHYARTLFTPLGISRIVEQCEAQTADFNSLVALHTTRMAQRALQPGDANRLIFTLLQPVFEEHLGAHRLTWHDAYSTSPNTTAPSIGGSRQGPFIGLPASGSIVGKSLGVRPQAYPPCKQCGSNHSSWECPIRYFKNLGEPCPGFDAQGNKDPSAWAGDDITPDTRKAWKLYINKHDLTKANNAPGVVNF